jgi:class 3 adenylate cyclase
MKKKDLVFKHSKNDLSSTGDDIASVFTFKKQSSVTTWAGTGLVDQLIDYLTVHLAGFADQEEVLQKFEALAVEVLANCTDPELHRILKEQGWTGAHFQLAIEPPFIDPQSCLNALSNYYLKVNSQPALNDIGVSADIESHQLDQILPFCPDVLVTYLKRQPINNFSSGPRRLTFRGACMLADISGFSKFSGAMCSKGVSGLDDLREATNGFLGYFVKQVYEYEGDGKLTFIHGRCVVVDTDRGFSLNVLTVIAFAGDALICAFRDTADGISESCFRALQCAHVLRQHKTAALSTHIGVSCGEMQIALLGGHNDQWCYVMNGECVSQLAACIEDAGSQEVAITEECYEYAQIHDAHPQTPAAFRNKLLVDDKRKPSGNYLLKTIGVRRTTTPPPPLSPFINNPEHPGHAHAAAGHDHTAVWNHLKHYGHVHEVASDVMVKQKSDHLVDEGQRKAALLSLGQSESDLSVALEHSIAAANGIAQKEGRLLLS